MSTLLSLLAVVLSVLTLSTVVVLRPAAQTVITAQSSRGGPVTIGATCTHYAGAQVTVAAPGLGTIVVRATVGVGINHTSGVRDEARIVLATTNSDCSVNNYTAFVSVPPTLPTDPFHFYAVPLLRALAVPGAATYGFYVNGIMAMGGDAGDRFDSASLVATFHPS